MNSNTPTQHYICPVIGCKHRSTTQLPSPFPSKNSLLTHLNSTCHTTSLHLVDHSRCKESGIYVCCTHKCPSSPRRFFSSQRALDIHYNTHHKTPEDTTPPATGATPLTIATSHIFSRSQRNNLNHWTHGLTFIDDTYDHEPPDFRTTWRHMLRGRQKAAFVTLQAAIIRSIVVASTHTDDTAAAAPFWWLLLHLDMLIFAPSTKKQRDNLSIQHTIDDRIQAAFCGDIAFLFQSAMAVKRHTQNTRPSAHSMNRSAQMAADNDDYRTAVARACTSQTVASIGPENIAHVNKLYTDPVPDRGYTHPARIPLHQRYPLPGDICKTIKIAAKNKGTGVNSDSIDLLTLLVKSKIPTVKDDLRFIFDLIFQNRLPPQTRRYFTDVYLFCLHKSPTDPSKLRPLGIPTAIRRIVASHVARTLKHKFASHLLPFNYAVGIPNGSSFVVKAMQLSIEKYITTPQTQGHTPSRAAIFFDLTNQFNSVSRQEFFHVIATHFPELLPLTLLFYDNPMTVHHKWNDGSWRQFLMREGVSQGCPLSPLFASFVVANLIKPIDSLLRDRAAARLASGDPGDDGFGGISHLLGYVDDISSCVYLPDLPFLCETLKTNGDNLGCFINPSKTRILTSCIGVSPIPELYTTNASLATQLTDTISRFSTEPHPTDRSLPPLPVELLSGFRLLGHPVGSASFAREFFTTCLAAVESDIACINETIDDDQTKLRLFAQCTLQKIPHLLSSDVLYHLPTDIDDPPWEEWNGPLTAATDTIISTFLSRLLKQDTLPLHSTLISQLGLAHGGLGLLSPQTRAVPDFVLSMAAAHRNATTGFALHPDSSPHLLDPTLRDLFEITSLFSHISYVVEVSYVRETTRQFFASRPTDNLHQNVTRRVSSHISRLLVAATMSTLRLRRPNFDLLPFVPTASSSSSSSSANDAPSSSLSRIAVAAAIGGGGSTHDGPSPSSTRRLADYARLCHERILLHRNDRGDDDDGESDDRDEGDSPRRRDGGGGRGENNDDDARRRRKRIGEESVPSMERCIALLEPILGSFVSSCIANDETRARKTTGDGTSSSGARRGIGRVGEIDDPVGEDDDDDNDDDDEVPPQLTRVARFFPQRYVPMRRALLRPIPHTGDDGVVELAVQYRLRLAKACLRRGLLADAEYEALRTSLDRSRDVRRGDRRIGGGDDEDDEDDRAGVERRTKRRRIEGGNDDADDDGDCDDAALMERVRLSLMRLPADFASSSSSRGRSAAAWRHVVESISKCRSRWAGIDDVVARRNDGDRDDRRVVVDPDRIADWALSSWTAMTLARGIPDRVVVPPPRIARAGVGVDVGGVLVDHHHRGRCLDPIEARLAALLSDRKDGEGTTTDTAVARAVGRRIDSLLAPTNISSLNGIHLYSLGRLMASFAARDDAIAHVASSVCRCGAATAAFRDGGGGGGSLVGMEPLSRLMAVFVCCCRASSSSVTSATVTGSIGSIVRNLDVDLRAKLEDDGFMRTVVVQHGGGVGGYDPHAAEKTAKQQHRSMTLARRRAISFLDAVLSSTAHLLKCCEI